MRYILYFFTCVFLLSCKKDAAPKIHNTKISNRKVLKDSVAIKENSINNNKFQNTGKKIVEFVPNTYELQYSAKGDLNKDGISDAVVVLRKKGDTLGERRILILLKNSNGIFNLDKISETALPTEYADNGFKNYSMETIEIKDGKLSLQSYGRGGTVGNIFSEYQYYGNQLVLTHINTYDVGAGSWITLNYDVLEGNFEEEVTNTMKEDMPTETKNYNLKKVKYLFETASPLEIITEAYRKIQIN